MSELSQNENGISRENFTHELPKFPFDPEIEKMEKELKELYEKRKVYSSSTKPFYSEKEALRVNSNFQITALADQIDRLKKKINLAKAGEKRSKKIGIE